MFLSTGISSFAAINEKLQSLPNQVIGFANSICETGEPYVEFAEYSLARPDDVKVIEAIVADQMWRRINGYLSSRDGRIYWRIPFESEVSDTSVVVRYDENGPDKDILTGRNCVLDSNWRGVRCYCRLYRASCHVDFSTVRASIAA